MTPFGILFVLIASVMLFRLPRRWAPLPLLAGAAYMPLEEVIEVGPFNFTIIRILVAVGVVRVLMRNEHVHGGMKKLDRMMILWGICAVVSSLFHKVISSALVFRLGMIYDGLGIYFLFRIFVRETEGIFLLSRIVIIVLMPVALEMVYESVTGKNAFAFLGGVEESEVRDGKVRAQGPFAHAILAGTVGAVSWPLLLPLWRQKRNLALLGIAVSGTMVLCSRSSGPIMTSFAILAGLLAWKIKTRMRMLRWGAAFAIIGLHLVMEAPVWYLLARIDLTGSSTGWHRAELIDVAVRHLDEWWFAGTDYTRHWIAYGVGWSKDHVDITNHYIKMGVIGGLPLMFAFIAVLVAAFRALGKVMQIGKDSPFEERFMIWTLGAILFGHAVTFLSISYFDQSIVFFLMLVAGIGSQSLRRAVVQPVKIPVTEVPFETWAKFPSS